MAAHSRRTRPIVAAAIILLILVPMILLWRTGYFQRHYGFAGFPERIAVFLYDGERVLKPDEYALSARFSDEDLPVSPIADGYAVDGGEYGVYRFTLVCGGRTASFRLWNTNNWWRTSVILRMAPDGSGLEQVNCVMNNNPPFIETFFVPWTHPAE